MRIPLFVVATVCSAISSGRAETLSGTVRSGESPVPGIFVTALDSTRGVSFSTRTDTHGRYTIDAGAGTYVVTAHGRGWKSGVRRASAGTQDFALVAATRTPADLEPHRYFSMLPDDDEKRRFAVDCLGCHSLNARIVLDKNGKPWDEKGWTVATEKMMSFAGHTTRFPILPPDRDAKQTAAYVSKHITADAIQRACSEPSSPVATTVAHDVTEYDLPDPNDFPHDLMRDGRGRVLVTGMFSGLMYVLDPATGKFETVEIPVPQANPRALDVDAFGDWWILCGFPNKIARYRAKNGKWDVFDIGMYGHSVGVDSKHRAWFNGHFTRDPVQFGYVDVTTRKTQVLEAPATPMPKEQGSPIPYELRVGPDGSVWMTELAGNRLLRHDPSSGETKAFTMASPHSGPRRCDIGPDGIVWVPEFAAGKLARFDPASETFEELDIPVRDSLPYCTRVDPRRGVVWTSLCAGDAIARFDPKTRRFDIFELPTRNAFIRHLDVDPETGDVWGAYSHSPNLEMRIVRLSAAN
jgi:virginiamycin B lyase